MNICCCLVYAKRRNFAVFRKIIFSGLPVLSQPLVSKKYTLLLHKLLVSQNYVLNVALLQCHESLGLTHTNSLPAWLT